MPERPGGVLAKRPLQFVWVVDCSGSMTGRKMDSLNLAIREAIRPMQDVAAENPNAEVLVRALTFSSGVQWHISQPTEVNSFIWSDLSAGGETNMGKALLLLADALKAENMPDRGLPPVLVLISDGQPTDDFSSGLKALMAQPWGIKSVRISVAIGEDADMAVLQQFIGNPEITPLVANNVQDLVKMIKWASTVPLKAASNPASRVGSGGTPSSSVVIPIPPPAPANPGTVSATDVF